MKRKKKKWLRITEVKDRYGNNNYFFLQDNKKDAGYYVEVEEVK